MAKTLENFKKKFRTLLAEAGEKRVSKKNVSRHFRRLDSIARLLEGGSICAAVYFHPTTKTIWIANNKIHATSRQDNKEIKRIKEIFALISQPGSSIEKIIDYLSDIIYWHVSQEKRYEKSKLDNVNIKDKISKWIEELFLSGEKSKSWKEQMIAEEDDKNIIFVLQKTAKTVRDFIKVRSFLLENKNKDATANGILAAINAGRFQIVHMEAKDVHAEMRLLAKKIAANDQDNEEVYFGISKLCCNHCALAMQSFAVKTRGIHGQGANWGLPSFVVAKSSQTKTFFGDSVHSLWKSLSPKDKSKAKNYIESKESSPIKGNAKTGRGMYADSSSSDLEFGVPLSTGSEEEQIKDFNLQKVWELKEVKQLYAKQYDWLVEIGCDLAEIVDLYKEAWPKFKELTAKRTLEFIGTCDESDFAFNSASPKEVFDKLCELYSADNAHFERVVSTPPHLVRYHGFNELVSRLESSSSSEGSYADDEGRSSDDYSALENEYRDDHGWDYDYNSEDSQNCWTYKDSSEETCLETFDNAESEEESDASYSNSLRL